MRVLTEISKFLRRARRQLRSGELSREPLQLLRVEWKGDMLECDWLMRSADPWDKHLPPELAMENQTLQALRDALMLRAIIFRSFPAVGLAQLRMFRSGKNHQLELVMTRSISDDARQDVRLSVHHGGGRNGPNDPHLPLMAARGKGNTTL